MQIIYMSKKTQTHKPTDGGEYYEKKSHRSRFFHIYMEKSHQDGRNQDGTSYTNTDGKEPDTYPYYKKQKSRQILVATLYRHRRFEKSVHCKRDKAQKHPLQYTAWYNTHKPSTPQSAQKSAKSDSETLVDFKNVFFEIEIGAKKRTKDHLSDRDSHRLFDIETQVHKDRYQDRSPSNTKKSREKSHEDTDCY